MALWGMLLEWLGRMQGLDEAMLRAVHGTPAWAIPIFFAFTVMGGGWGLIALVPFAWRRSTRAITLWLLAGITVTSGVVSLVKALVGRARPCDALPWCAPLSIASPGGPSFPSGHAAGSFAFAVFVALHAPRLSPVLLAYAAVVSVSRCVLGVHYPSDVVFGALLGAGLGALFGRIAMKRNANTGHAKADRDECRRSGPREGDAERATHPHSDAVLALRDSVSDR